ncbi:DMT family transporter [Nocardioides koreensis]|uniref:DMT family transporter n=1 Tax=Nocardioides koreensis TaxID=433651 RepID=A0ABP5L9P1_9ACTN
MTTQLVAVGAAAASAATFGLSTSLQHLVSSSVEDLRPDRLLVTLVRTPLWVLGAALSGAAFGLHAVALSRGSLVLVQPVIVTGVVFAVLIRSALDRRVPTRAEAGWALVTWAGLAAFLAATGPSARTAHVPSHALPTVAVLLLAAATGVLVARRRTPGTTGRGMWLGAVAGVLYGLVAVLLKLVLTTLDESGYVATLVTWPIWIMTAAGLAAVVVNQRAYQSSRLSVSMPVLNIVNVLVALVFAAVVLGELPEITPGALGVQAVGLLVIGLGVFRLAGLEEDAQEVLAPDRGRPTRREAVARAGHPGARAGCSSLPW